MLKMLYKYKKLIKEYIYYAILKNQLNFFVETTYSTHSKFLIQ